MRRITWYVLSELLLVFTVTLTGITLMIILAGVATEGMRVGLGLGAILRLVPYFFPVALQISVPATILMASSSVFGRMSADNEIVALKSMGISPIAVLKPAFFLAFSFSLVAVWINDIAVSWGRTGMYRVVLESVEQVAYRMLKTQRTYQSQGFTINVKDVDGRTLIEPSIRIHGSGNRTVRINASAAELKADPVQNTLTVSMTNMNVDQGDIWIALDKEELQIPLSSALRKGDSRGSPSLIPLRRIGKETREQAEVTGHLERQAATAAAFEMMSGDFSQLADAGEWNQRRSTLEGARARLHRLKLEPWRRWANGFSCFFFVLVGAPLAIQMRTANVFTTFAACFLPILLIYYPLLAFGVDRCKDGVMPPYTVWLGNLVLCAMGAWIMRRVIRY